MTAFGSVPGSNPHSAALIGMAAALRGEIDMVTVKTDALAHQSRLGDARLFRVRVTGPAQEQREAFGRAVRRQLEAELYDVVHCRGPYEGAIVAELRAAMQYRFVYEMSSYPDESEGVAAEAFWLTAHEACMEAADLILVPTEASARSLGERGWGGKCAVVQPGCDVNAFDWWPSLRDEVARLLYLGSFGADRDLGTVLGAIKEVSKQREVRVLIAGDPSDAARERLRRLVRAFDLNDTVQVRGEPTAVSIPPLIAACDVGIISASATPRFREHGDLPQPLLEFLACRRPVVAAAVPGLAEVVRDEKEGLLYLPGEESSLADGILTLLEGGALRDRLVEAGYDRVRSRFSGSARRRRIAEVYEMLMSGSQSYDAWDEAFDKEPTGFLDLPASMAALPDARDLPADLLTPHGDSDVGDSDVDESGFDESGFDAPTQEGPALDTYMPPRNTIPVLESMPASEFPADGTDPLAHVPETDPGLPETDPGTLHDLPAGTTSIDTHPGLTVDDEDTSQVDAPPE